jgi:hypothetical protein
MGSALPGCLVHVGLLADGGTKLECGIMLAAILLRQSAVSLALLVEQMD